MVNIGTEITDAPTSTFMPIQIESLRVDRVLDFDIYIDTGRELVLYRSKQLPFADK
jgi:hypothetical protein